MMCVGIRNARAISTALGLLAIFDFSGCAESTREQLKFAQETVRTALDTWKRGEEPTALRSGAAPVEFHDDDWEKAAQLVTYEILKTYPENDGTARCAVALTVQYAGQPPTQLRVTYQIVTTPKVVVGRDPFS